MSCVGTAFSYTVLKIQNKFEAMGRRGRRHNQLLITLRKQQDNGGRKRKYHIASYG